MSENKPPEKPGKKMGIIRRHALAWLLVWLFYVVGIFGVSWCFGIQFRLSFGFGMMVFTCLGWGVLCILAARDEVKKSRHE